MGRRQPEPLTLTFKVTPEEEEMTLGNFLRRNELSVSLIRSLKYLPHGLAINGEAARTNRKLRAEDCVLVHLPEEEGFSSPPEEQHLEILFESPHVMMLEKPAGLVVHPTLSHKENTLANGFCGLMKSRGSGGVFRPIGRLDRNTSGLLMLAMNPYAAPILAKSMQKSYLALVQGELESQEGVLDFPLAACPDSAIMQRVDENGKPSCTEYRVLAAGGGISLVEVKPKTGRTHQIRVHFAHWGHPLLGDDLYGGDTHVMQRHALHCARLSFIHPQGERMDFTSPIAFDMRQAMDTYGCKADGNAGNNH